MKEDKEPIMPYVVIVIDELAELMSNPATKQILSFLYSELLRWPELLASISLLPHSVHQLMLLPDLSDQIYQPGLL